MRAQPRILAALATIALLAAAGLARGQSTDAGAVTRPVIVVPSALALDLPHDDGSAIAVTWPGTDAERRLASGEASGARLAYEYVVTIAGSVGGPALEAVRIPSVGGWKRDLAFKFGVSAHFSEDHAAIIDPRALFSSQTLALAALGDATATAVIEPRLGADAIGQAKAILAARKVASAAALDLRPDVLAEITNEVVLTHRYTLALASRRTDVDGAPLEPIVTFPPVRAEPNWWNGVKANSLVVLVIVGAAIFYFIGRARKNPDLYLRRIGGLDAIDEALGRATEMGKPVLFVHGLETLQKVPTIAAINILGEVAKKVAAYDSRLICANYDPIVLTVSQETVKEGFLRAGRPDAFNQEDVFIAGAEQFSYVAAVDGIMLRQRPAANIYAGYFYAESLLLAETGAQTGAIQIAATDAYTQLPFFVTTCDYTLMGEELYAASAYLSRDPPLLGSLRGQDLGKALVIVYVLVGTALATMAPAGTIGKILGWLARPM